MDALVAANDAAVAGASGPSGSWATQFLHVYLKTTFGPIVQLVGTALLTRGGQSLDELYRTTELDVPTLKKALLTLIQQDIVLPRYEVIQPRPGAPPPKRPLRPRVLYSVQVDHLRHRTRFASYLVHVRQQFSVQCEIVMQTLLLHGKVTTKQLLDLTCAHIQEQNRLDAQEQHKKQVQAAALNGQTKPTIPYIAPPPMAASDRKEIHNIFRQLIAARFITRVPGLVVPEERTSPTEETNTPPNNSDILATFRLNNEAIERKEQAAIEEAAAAAGASAAQAALKASSAAASSSTTATAASRKRKKIVDDDSATEDEKDSSEVKSEKSSTTTARKKKKTKKELEADAAQAEREKRMDAFNSARLKEESETQASLDRSSAAMMTDETMGVESESKEADDGHILWVVNHAEFLREFRKKSIVDYVNTAVSPAAGFLVQQLLAVYPPESMNKPHGERPPVYDTQAIFHLCQRAAREQNKPNPIGSSELADETLHQLLGDPSGFFERKSHPPGYLINFTSFFKELRLKHLQALCRQRWGPLAARIFRILLTHHRLEDTQIIEYATAPKKEVKRLLQLMHIAKYVSMQEIPRSADRMPARTFFLWGVDIALTEETYLESLYFSWCNLRQRLELETDQTKPILDKVDTSKPITDTEKAQIETWKKAAERLETGLNQVNQLIMLFQDL